MVETLFGILVTVIICAIVVWLAEKIAGSVPAKFSFDGVAGWIIRVIFYLILIAWVLDKYGIYHIAA